MVTGSTVGAAGSGAGDPGQPPLKLLTHGSCSPSAGAVRFRPTLPQAPQRPSRSQPGIVRGSALALLSPLVDGIGPPRGPPAAGPGRSWALRAVAARSSVTLPVGARHGGVGVQERIREPCSAGVVVLVEVVGVVPDDGAAGFGEA